MFGALRPDTGSFSRLVVWLGLALIVLALLLPWLAFRETAALRISQSELRGLTPDARASILDRQELARDVNERSWWAFVLLIPGLALMGWGAIGLWRQQTVDEERARAEAQKAVQDAKVVPQDADDVEEAAQADVIVEAPAATAGAAAPAPVIAIEPSPPVPVQEGAARPTQAEERRRRQRELEAETLARVAALVPPGYTFQPRVKVSRDDARVLLDGLMRAPQRQRDIIIDVRISPYPQALRLAIDHAMANNLRYERLAGRDAFTWLIMVNRERELTEEERHQAEAAAGAHLVSDVVQLTVVSSPAEIFSIPGFVPPKP